MRLLVAWVVLITMTGAGEPATRPGEARPVGQRVLTARIRVGELDVLFHDNSESPGILSGVQSLVNVREAEGFDAYDPDSPGASAGLNFEHIIAGHENAHNAFTPRHGPYRLDQLGDGRSVRLVRGAKDSPWAVASTMTYMVREPHYIDFEFTCRAYDASRFGPRGYAILFWANYMNDVAEVPIRFRGVSGPGEPEAWIAADAPPGHPHWNKGGTYRSQSANDLAYDDDLKFRLNSWSYDWPRFTKPFYFGRAARDMVFILMFDRMHSEADEVRFSLFKFKLDRFPRPAWDFQYVIHRVEEDRTYGYRGRLVWKRFVSPEDCLREYETWASEVKRSAE